MGPGPRLRIAYVLDTYEDSSAGGVVTARRFVDALRARHEVTVVAAGPAGEGRVGLPAFYPPLLGPLMRKMGFVFAVPRRRTLEEVFRRVDVVHVQFPFWLGLRAVAIARAVGTPVVSAFHVQPENLFRNVGLRSPRLAAWTYRLFVRQLFERSDAVVCPSRFALEALRSRGLTVPAEVVSNGIAPGFAPAAPERPARHRGKVLVAAVGRLAREKRLDVAIEGVRRSRYAARIQLVITGRGPQEREVRGRATTLPVPAEVGFLSEPALRSLLATADLLVHASEVELEGVAVLEALACGTPALVARSPESAATQFALSGAFLFEPGDPDDLARRLDDLIASPDRLRAARAACLARAQDFRLDDSVARLEALYRRVARERAGPPAATATGSPSRGARAAPTRAPPGAR
jgi:1,2-diacylglycerol 3-alpha-glucosyltransferase